MHHFFAVAITLWVVSGAFAQTADTRQPVPDVGAQNKALEVISDIYKPDYAAARTPEQKVELARKLILEAVATKDDTAGCFVLLRIARDVAVQQGSLAMAFKAIEETEQRFVIDALEQRYQAATDILKVLKSREEFLECAPMLNVLVAEAVTADRYSLAQDATSLAVTAARRARDAEWTKRALAKEGEVKAIAAAFERLVSARESLAKRPADPSANLKVGSFYCFVKGDWSRGIPLLALGDDETLSELAKMEIEKSPDALALGDGWWKFAEKLDDPAQIITRQHAAEWYRKALPRLSGLTKTRVERAIAQVAAVNSPVKKEDESLARWKKLVGDYVTDHPQFKNRGVLSLGIVDDGLPAFRRGQGAATRASKFVDGVWLFDWGNVDLFAIRPRNDGVVEFLVFYKACSNGFEKAQLPKRKADQIVIYARSR